MTSTKSAELIKHASNAFLAMKISFINAVASVCESVGANVNQVVHGVGTDSRIGPRFLNPGIGYGGSCFPKDVHGFPRPSPASADTISACSMKSCASTKTSASASCARCAARCGRCAARTLGVLGLAFKGGTDDIRESPALFLVQALLQEGSKITAYDPAAMERTQEVMASGIKFANSAYEAAQGADALLILTEWEEFASLDLNRLRKELKYPIVIDGRNLYDPEVMAAQGFTYYSVGRAASHPDGVPAAVLKNGLNGKQMSSAQLNQKRAVVTGGAGFLGRICAMPCWPKAGSVVVARQPAHRPPREPRTSAQRTRVRICRKRYLRALRRGAASTMSFISPARPAPSTTAITASKP